MIKKLSSFELALMKKSGQILFATKEALKAKIAPGVTTIELDQLAEKEIRARGGLPAFKGYQGYKFTICASVNEALIHGLPTSTPLKSGDLLKIDLGAIYQKYYSDSAFTVSVGKATPENTKLIEAAKAAFHAGVAEFKLGNRLGDVEAAIGKKIKNLGLFGATAYAGHGINTVLHAEPIVQNEGKANTGPKLVEGMAIAIEPMILQTSGETYVSKDGWTVFAKDGRRTAHYEETVALIDGKAVILTGGDNG